MSSDPAGVCARLTRFDYMQRNSSDGEELLQLLAGVLIRLDRVDGYDDLVKRVSAAGETVVPVLREIIEQDTGEPHRRRICDGASRALDAVRDTAEAASGQSSTS
jgi:hypothetical protein